MQIGFLTCPGTHPGSPTRRPDAYEHDVQVDALRAPLGARGIELAEIDWRSPVEAFAGLPLILIGTPWDYHDDEAAFLTQLDLFESAGHTLCNSAQIVRWNSRKTYLRDLAAQGAATIPTIWLDRANAHEVRLALDEFGCDAVVVKRQVGAGAEGQSLHRRAEVEDGWQIAQPCMVQPFLPRIQSEGEYSFLFVDGELSHALVKQPAGGDYRVQSLYGGREETITPETDDLAAAFSVMRAIPFATPLYARIDMVRSEHGQLLLMEAELIEPYLYPRQGPKLGEMMAEAIAFRLNP